jgi:MATE family multidrug resistance protein
MLAHNLLHVMDTMIVGRISTEALAGVGIGTGIMNLTLALGIGIIMSLDTVVSQAEGANDRARSDAALVQILYLMIPVFVLLFGIVHVVAALLPAFGIAPEIVPHTREFIGSVSWSLFPFLVGAVFQRYWQCREVVVPFTVISFLGLGVNYFFVSGLALGNFGFPNLGVHGAGLGTTVTRTGVVIAALLVTVFRRRRESRLRWTWDPELAFTLVKLGVPSSIYILFEGGAFLLATILAGQLGATQSAAHNVVLAIASTTFMIPLGISGAAAVRVGTSVGAKDYAEVRRAGLSALILTWTVMVITAGAMLIVPEWVLAGFHLSPEVLPVAMSLLVLAGVFQIFDGTQVTLTGALRGLGDVRTPMIANGAGYYVLGLPTGIALCFGLGWQAMGLWVGLTIGLGFVAAYQLWIWRKVLR